VKSALEQSGCILRIGIGTKRRLAETHVDSIVEALHPNHHLGSASGARPTVGKAVERLPEGSPEPNLESERERPSGAIGASRDGMTGSVCIWLARPLLQRERYSVILDKEAGGPVIMRKTPSPARHHRT